MNEEEKDTNHRKISTKLVELRRLLTAEEIDREETLLCVEQIKESYVGVGESMIHLMKAFIEAYEGIEGFEKLGLLCQAVIEEISRSKQRVEEGWKE